METYIKGTYKRSIFSSNDGYKVGLIKIKETDDQDLTDYVGKQFTFTGLFAELNLDEDYIFYGNLVDNEKYGFQYKVNRYEKIMPEDKDGLVIFLSSSIFPGVGEKTAKDIVEILGEDCLSMISDNYECLLMVPKITEKKAIDIRNRLLKYNASYETVVYLTNLGFGMKDALKIYNHYLEDSISQETLSFYMMELNALGKVIIDGDKYVLYKYYKDEEYIAQRAFELANRDDTKIDNIEVKIEKLEHFFDINYNDEQKKAIKQAIEKNFSIITGGPGTGKTTIIKGIVELYKMITGYSYEKLVERLVLLAPTGRASKRMSEACAYPASTIHRYLKWNKETNEFGLNERNKANCEFVIIDETSMIDSHLMANFFKAMSYNVKLVFIGDYNQLESVGPGNILKDLIDSEMINTIFLKEIYRQDQNSYITQLAYEVNTGEMTEEFLNKKDDYNFIKCENIDVLKACSDIAKKAIDKGYDLKNVQILAPIYKGDAGIDNLNKVLQKIFNPASNDKNETYDADIIYREGDKVLQLENRIDDNVFNGDIGFIKKIQGTEITIDFDGNIVKYKPKDYKAIKHGYAISIHKSQGSEFEIVIMPIINNYRMMLYRKLVYTGITRAKKSLILVGDPMAFSKAVYNKGNKERKTLLKNMLEDNIK